MDLVFYLTAYFSFFGQILALLSFTAAQFPESVDVYVEIDGFLVTCTRS